MSLGWEKRTAVLEKKSSLSWMLAHCRESCTGVLVYRLLGGLCKSHQIPFEADCVLKHCLVCFHPIYCQKTLSLQEMVLTKDWASSLGSVYLLYWDRDHSSSSN